ncbi:ADYC domain-containing protein [Hyalangium gracile]|uniref:ADYC domain-containing protein n=1 Tax=Hyalangium gracile TaxID=394092 RepID=UPI001CCCB0C0|nr:ADYC domain-containing protein [Hyalangium gracile]
MKLQRLLLSSFCCVAILAACGGPIEPGEEEVPSLRTSEAAEMAEQDPGWPTQGTQLHASSLTSASFLEATLNGVPIENLHLEQGELVGSQPYTLSRTTPSMLPCTAVASGLARSCGFTAMGIGTCTPGEPVTLGGGACGLGSCTGDPVVRVCAGTATCEHTSPSRLVSGDDACINSCPSVQFTCPTSGVYNVMAGPYQTGTSWSMTLVPDTGALPGKRVLRGTALQGALLKAQVNGEATAVRIEAVVNAAQVPVPGLKSWDATGETFLYHLKTMTFGGAAAVDVCQPGAGASNTTGHLAVPISGVFDTTYGRRSDEDPSRFTFGCDSGVIAKCYRWGYKPWLEGQDSQTSMKDMHEACTRMARADYCGNGTSFTLDGTPIHPWDDLDTAIRPLPENASTPLFEAGWSPHGAVCLSKTRWEHLKPMPAGCPLVSPTVGVPCPPGQRTDTTGQLCATVCNTPEEAKAYNHNLRLFNESQYNVIDE